MKSAIVGRLLKCLGWDRDDLRQVRMEFSTEDGGKVDFALLSPSKKPALFIEAKKVGNITDAGERQLLRYAFESGVPIAILTDGIKWNFDLPLLECSYAERRFCSLNLRDHDLEHCVGIFLDFLFRDDVLSGAARAKAHEIIDREKARKEVKSTLPRVWIDVFSEAKDSHLAEALKKAVVSKCGHTPREDDIKEFLDKEFDKIKCGDIDNGVLPEKRAEPIGVNTPIGVGGGGRKRSLSFEEMGIPLGSRLKFIDNNGIEVEIVDTQRNYVRLRGVSMSFGDATNKARGKKLGTPVRPSSYWNYKGRLLRDMFEEYHERNR